MKDSQQEQARKANERDKMYEFLNTQPGMSMISVAAVNCIRDMHAAEIDKLRQRIAELERQPATIHYR